MAHTDLQEDESHVLGNEKIKFVDRIRAFREYRRVSSEFRKAFDITQQKFSAQLLRDEAGREIDGPHYIAGLRIGGKLTGEESGVIYQDIVNILTSRLGAFDDSSGLRLPLEQLRIISPLLMCPIVEIPHISFNPKGMSEKQKNDLAGLQRDVERAGSVMMQINMQHINLKGGFAQQEGQLPEGIVMEDGTDHKVEIAFTPSFNNQREIAEKVVKSILEIPVITKRRNNMELPLGSLTGTP